MAALLVRIMNQLKKHIWIFIYTFLGPVTGPVYIYFSLEKIDKMLENNNLYKILMDALSFNPVSPSTSLTSLPFIIVISYTMLIIGLIRTVDTIDGNDVRKILGSISKWENIGLNVTPALLLVVMNIILRYKLILPVSPLLFALTYAIYMIFFVHFIKIESPLERNYRDIINSIDIEEIGEDSEIFIVKDNNEVIKVDQMFFLLAYRECREKFLRNLLIRRSYFLKGLVLYSTVFVYILYMMSILYYVLK